MVEPLLGGTMLTSVLSSGSMTETAGFEAAKAREQEKRDQDAAETVEGDTEESTSKESDDAVDVEVIDDDIVGEDEDEEEEGDDDDDITDFGLTPKCRYVKCTPHDDGLCPFRGTFHTHDMSSTIRQNCVSHTQLRELLIQEGCSEGECVEVFFGLLHHTPASSKARQCGCIPLDIFSKYFPEIAKEKTRLDWETIQALANGDLRALGMSKKASKRFRKMFSRLGRHTIAGLPKIQSSGSLSGTLGRIPSSGSLTMGRSPARRKSSRERMEAHLDTRSYAAEIAI